MNNKIGLKYLIFLIGLFCFNVSYVFGETTSCEYSDLGITVVFDEAGTASLSQTEYDTYSFDIPVVDWFYDKKTGAMEYVNELKQIETELYGSCPKNIYACTYEKQIWGDAGLNVIWDQEAGLFGSNVKKIFLFYSENNMKENSTLKDLPNNELKKGDELADNFMDTFNDGTDFCGGEGLAFLCGLAWSGTTGVENLLDLFGFDIDGDGGGIDLYYQEYKSCNYVDYTGKNPTFNLACPNITVHQIRFNAAINEYLKCDKTDGVCISQAITEVNEKDNIMKNYCNTILQHHSFDGGTEEECLRDCLDIAKTIKQAKINAGIISGENGDCGFSDRLLVWISNILRWIKYILPVVVIILGILDFIKAIGSQKDDEMKKAQGSFIKRLIAAALVFLIPLIIEFVLDKMGFGYDACGLF